MQLIAVCFILLVSCLGATHSYDCERNLYTDMRQCLRNEDLDFFPELLTGFANGHLKPIQFPDPAIMCRQIGAYKIFVECAMKPLRKCLRVIEMEGILPDITRVRKGMDFLCQHSKDFDYYCQKDKKMDIERCFSAAESDLGQRNHEANKRPSNEIVCTSADLIYNCSALHLRKCPKLTKAVVLELLNKHLVPSMCEDKPPGRPRKSYVEGGATSLITFFNPFLAMVVSMATMIFLRWSG